MAATLVFLLSGCRQGKTETGVAAVDSVVVTDTVVAPVKPTKSRTALYLDSLGYLNVAEQDSTIAVDLMYARADNFTGQVLYGDLREAYLHPDAMACLLEAQRLLRSEYPGYRADCLRCRSADVGAENHVGQGERHVEKHLCFQSCSWRRTA